VRFDAAGGPVRVKLTVFDAVASPSPLVAEQHDIDVQIRTGVLEITETLRINNPTRRTYVGEASSEAAPTTLSLHIPETFERVTFDKEFHGRQFTIADKRVVTNIPWPPGLHELKFTYHLPVEESQPTLERALDLPCSLVRVRVRGENADGIVCNLPRVAACSDQTAVFESSEKPIAAGHKVTVRFASVAAPWTAYGPWIAVAGLAGLILGTIGLLLRQRSSVKAHLPGRGVDGAPDKRRPTTIGHGRERRAKRAA
jgi:hypothetical protein